ncbi:MAG: hypothetical protein ACRDEA_12445, partial [Microcystaceae cyanobacterium]
ISGVTSMSIPQSIALPPGFEHLTKAQQIDYVQQLWNVIFAASDEVPLPEWHLDLVHERVSSQATAQVSTWSEVKQRLVSKYRER